MVISAKELRSPIILGCTQGAGKYMTGYKTVVGMVNGMLESMNITVPVALHLDHGSYEHCYQCIDAGFMSIMFDGSSYPIEENVAKTKELVEVCHKKGRSGRVQAHRRSWYRFPGCRHRQYSRSVSGKLEGTQLRDAGGDQGEGW